MDDNTNTTTPFVIGAPKKESIMAWLQTKDRLYGFLAFVLLFLLAYSFATTVSFETEVWEHWNDTLPILLNQPLEPEETFHLSLSYSNYNASCFLLWSQEHDNFTTGASFRKGLRMWTITGQVDQLIYACMIFPRNETVLNINKAEF